MNVEDPFADDLKSFDATVAQLATDGDRQTLPPSAAPAAPTTTPETFAVRLGGRREGRSVPPPKGAGRQAKVPPVAPAAVFAGSKARTNDAPLPWEVDDDSGAAVDSHMTAASSRDASSVSFIAGGGRRGRETTTGSAHDDDKDDPLAFLERGLSPAAQVAASSYAVADVSSGVAVPVQEGQREMEEEMERQKQRDDLLSSLDAVGMELDELQSAVETLRIKADSELTDLETRVIERQTELASRENGNVAERRAYEAYHQRRLGEVNDCTPELIQRQEEETVSRERERYEGQMRVLSAAVVDMQARVDQLLQQRELLLRSHRFDERGIFVALAEEAKEENERSANDASGDFATGGGDAGSVVDAKMNVALRLLWQHHKSRLESLSNRVVQYIHQETMDVAREVRERHERACMQAVVKQKEGLGEFMQDFLQRYRGFFRHRAELRSRNMTALREDLQKATEQLRLHARKRLETRTREVAVKMDGITRRFGKLAVESIECVQRKAAALREGDESVARSQLADLEHRCQAERAVAEQLQRSEVEMLQQSLDRMRQWDDERRSDHKRDAEGQDSPAAALQQQVAQGICSVRAESITSKVREMTLAVQQRLREQLSRNRSHNVEGEGGHVFLTDETLATRMALQEKGAVVALLLEEVKKRQTELLATRLRCGELRERIAASLQEEVQTARQKRLTQEAHLANNELLRIAWGREQRELLKWGHERMFPCSDSSTTIATDTSARTHLPEATATVDIMNLLVERNQALVESRARLREQRDELFHTVTKERDSVLAERREVETRWVRLCEQLLDLMAKQNAMATQREVMAAETAKLEAAKELLNHDKKLFGRRRGEVQEETERLKRELQETLANKAELDALQQNLAAEQTAVMQERRRFVVGRGYPLDAAVTDRNAVQTLPKEDTTV